MVGQKVHRLDSPVHQLVEVTAALRRDSAPIPIAECGVLNSQLRQQADVGLTPPYGASEQLSDALLALSVAFILHEDIASPPR